MNCEESIGPVYFLLQMPSKIIFFCLLQMCAINTQRNIDLALY